MKCPADHNWTSAISTDALRIRWCRRAGGTYCVEAFDRLATGEWSRFALGDWKTEAEAEAYIAGITVGRE